MPRGDRTGPEGMGPMTGRAAGYCAGYDVPGYANPAPGRGMGRGMGRGWRRGNRRGWQGAGQGAGYGWYQPVGPVPAAPAPPPVAPPPPAPMDEQTVLEQEIAGLKAELAYLEQRLSGLLKVPGGTE